MIGQFKWELKACGCIEMTNVTVTGDRSQRRESAAEWVTSGDTTGSPVGARHASPATGSVGMSAPRARHDRARHGLGAVGDAGRRRIRARHRVCAVDRLHFMPLENLVTKSAISDDFTHFYYYFCRFHSILRIFVEKLFTNIFYRAHSMPRPDEVRARRYNELDVINAKSRKRLRMHRS